MRYSTSRTTPHLTDGTMKSATHASTEPPKQPRHHRPLLWATIATITAYATLAYTMHSHPHPEPPPEANW